MNGHLLNKQAQKYKFNIIASLILLFIAVFTLTSCDSSDNSTTTTLGSGAKSITLTVELPTETVEYTLKTDSNTLDEVLMEHDLANLTHLGMGSVINSIAGYSLEQDVDWYDIYINGEIVYIQSSNVSIEDGDMYSIKIIKL